MSAAAAGASSRVKLMPAAFRETAFIRRSLPATSGTIAWPAEIVSASTMPCTSAMTKRCSTRSRPSSSNTPTKSANPMFSTCPTCRIRFRGTRSASTPPNTESNNIGTALASPTMPIAANEPVSSYVT